MAVEALALRRRLLGDSHMDVAASLGQLGDVLLKQDRWVEAETRYRESMTVYRTLGATNSPQAADALASIAAALHAQNKLEAAETAFRIALAATRASYGEHPRLGTLLHDIGTLFNDRHKPTEAEAALKEAVVLRRKLLGPVHPDLAYSLYGLAEVLFKRGRYRDLEPLLAEHVAAEVIQRRESVPLLRVRARVLARRSQWTAAADDFRRIIEFAPNDHFNYLQYAPILVEIGDQEGYRRLCSAMVKAFHDTKDIAIAERMTKACLLLPDTGIDMATLDRWTEMAVREGQGHVYLPYYELARGWLAYRQGKWSETEEWMQKALVNKPGRSRVGPRDGQAFMILSMALSKLNRIDQARDAWSRGQSVLDRLLPKPDSGDQLTSWHDTLICRILMREARTLVER